MIRALIPLSVRGLNAGLYTSEQLDLSLRHVFGADTQIIRDGTYYVIESGERLVACGGWSRRRTLYGGDQLKEVEDPLLDPALEPARIRAFFVHPRRREARARAAAPGTCVEGRPRGQVPGRRAPGPRSPESPCIGRVGSPRSSGSSSRCRTGWPCRSCGCDGGWNSSNASHGL